MAQIVIGIDSELKDRFYDICRKKKMTISRFLEGTIKDFVRENIIEENEVITKENEKKESGIITKENEKKESGTITKENGTITKENEKKEVERDEFIKRHISEYRKGKVESKDLTFSVDNEDIILLDDLRE